MTVLDIAFRYRAAVGPRQLRAMVDVREVHGIHRLSLDEIGHTILVEYDASHLVREDVCALLRSAGLDTDGVAERSF